MSEVGSADAEYRVRVKKNPQKQKLYKGWPQPLSKVVRLCQKIYILYTLSYMGQCADFPVQSGNHAGLPRLQDCAIKFAYFSLS